MNHLPPGKSVAAGKKFQPTTPTTFSPRRIASAVALAVLAGSASTAWAAGLGRLTVQSALGQPLRAEVEVTSLARDEVASLSAKLGSQDAFRQAGMEFNPALSALRFAIERRDDGRAFVRISSTQPINEPFVDLLVELNWASGRVVREYTFLLDPPE
ncbi:MAG: pilus assembly protein FimV, partial [Burkholderiaceae bacterium]|nr:pilus assembly protein FimV [Burkholderiaceae bacterium]